MMTSDLLGAMALHNASDNGSVADLHRKLLIMQNDERALVLLPAMLFVGFLMVVGIVGNSAVCYVFLFRLKTTTQNVLFVFLAVFDLLSCCVAMPTEIVDMRYYFLFESELACKLIRFILAFCVFASIMTLVVIAVDRFRKVCRPLKMQMTPREAKLGVVAGCGVAGLSSVPAVVLYGKRTAVTAIPGVVGVDCSTSDAYLGKIYPFLYEMFQAVGFFALTTALIVIYVKIWREIRHHRRYLLENAGASLALIPTVSDARTDSSCPPSLHDTAHVSWGRHSNQHRTLERVSQGSQGRKPVLQLHVCLDDSSLPVSRLTSLEDLGRDSRESLPASLPNIAREDTRPRQTFDAHDVQANAATAVEERTQSCEAVCERTAGLCNGDMNGFLECPQSCPPSLQLARRKSDGGCVSVRQSGKERKFPSADHISADSSSQLEWTMIRTARSLPARVDQTSVREEPNRGGSAECIARESSEKRKSQTPLEKDSTEENNQQSTNDRQDDCANSNYNANSHSSHLEPTGKSVVEEDAGADSEGGRERLDSEGENLPSRNNSLAGNHKRNSLPRKHSGQSSSSKVAIHSTRTSVDTRISVGTRRVMTSPSAQRTTIIAFLVTAVFVGSFLPHLSLLIARSIDSSFDHELEGSALVAFNIFLRSYFVNNAANPIIYGFMNLQFRRECIRLVKCLCCPCR